MLKKIYNRLIYLVLPAMVFVLAGSGCGRKAPPVAPVPEKPPVVDQSDVKKQHQDDQRQLQTD